MLITLSTDFGYTDPFVGIMKGVIYSINPQAKIVDLTHGIAPQSVLTGALMLRHSVNYFPRGTIHVGVVDPGVGSARKPLLIEANDSFFIGPDNGIWSLALAERNLSRVIDLSNRDYHLKPTSATFHGRDIFAPVAAHLSLGITAEEFGESLPTYSRIDLPRIQANGQEIIGEIVYIDGFGNLFTNIGDHDLKDWARDQIRIVLRDIEIRGVSANYAAVAGGAYAALLNSWGLLEIAANKSNAQQQSGAKVGDKVQVFIPDNAMGS
jgi:S-adenosylmethionine hydrolase